MNYYAEAIEALLSPHIDFRRVVIDIAKKHPKVLIDALAQPSPPLWLDEVDYYLRSGKKVDAIKVWRAQTGLGLKEAKDAVEARMDEFPGLYVPKEHA